MGGSRPPWPWGLAVLLLLLSASSSDARTLFGDVQRSLLRKPPGAAPEGSLVTSGGLVESAPLQNLAASDTPAPDNGAGGAIMQVTTDAEALEKYKGRSPGDFKDGIIIALPSKPTPQNVKAAIAKASEAKAAVAALSVSAQSTGVRAQSNTDPMLSILLNERCLAYDPQPEQNREPACMSSPNERLRVCLEPDGTVVGYRDTFPAWATLPPDGYQGDDFLLCLWDERVAPFRNAQLVVLKPVEGTADVEVIATMYPGPSYKLPDDYTPALYVQDDGNLVVYDPGCNALAQTGTPWSPLPAPCLSQELDIIAGNAYVIRDEEDPSSAGDNGRELDVANGGLRQEYNVKCQPGAFVTGYNYQTVEENGAKLLVGVTEITCSDGSTVEYGGWVVDTQHLNGLTVTMESVSTPRASGFFKPEGVKLLPMASGEDFVVASVECRAGTLIAGMYGSWAVTTAGATGGGDALSLICRSACTQELSSTGRAADSLRNCTSGVDQINGAGATCSSDCGTSGTLSVTCSALGLWNVDSQCAPLTSDTTTGTASGDRTKTNAPGKENYNFTCPPGTFIKAFPIAVADDTSRRFLGIKPFTCSNSDGSGMVTTSPGYGVQTGDEVPYNMPNGFRNARVHSLKDLGILRLAVPPNTQANIATIGSLWNATNEACPDETRVVGVYGRYIVEGYVFTIGFVCRKVCTAMTSTEASLFGNCVEGTNVVGKVCSSSTCPAGFTGSVTATCTQAGVWQTVSTCTAEDLPCRGDPTVQDDSASYECDTTTTPRGQDCQGTCDAPNGFIGAVKGTCQGAGNWTFDGSCDALATTATHAGAVTRVMYTGITTQAVADATCAQTGGRVVEDSGAYGCEHDSQVIYMDNKYHIVNREAKYGQAVAQDLCQKLGGNLSSFADVSENAHFLQELGYGTAGFDGLWIGLFAANPTSDKSSYSWISTGQSPNFEPSPGGFWQTGEPNGNSSCVKMARQYGYWADEACKTPYGFTCEIAIAAVECPAAAPTVDNGAFDCAAGSPGEECVARCADGYVGAPRVQCAFDGSWGAMEGSCVQAAPETETFANKRWTLYPSVFLSQQAAKDYCAASNGTLITVKTADETSRLAARVDTYDRSVWLGLQNTGPFPSSTPAQYLWLDTNQTPNPYLNWGVQQPDGDMSGENNEGFCVVADKPAAAAWNDKPCNDEFIVACEYQNECQDALPTIAQATWDTCELPVAAGLFCNATCAENYEGSPSATCTANGWVPEGACTPIGCSTPETQANAEPFDCATGTAHESVCTAQCSTFFAGSVNATCSFGNWTYGGECTSTNCTADPTTTTTEPVGAFTCTNGQALGSTCEATCSAGYTGTVTATCGDVNPQEFSVSGTCTPNGCDSNVVPTPPANTLGNVSDSCTVPSTHSSNCTVPCVTGYSGTVTVTCTLGTWELAEGECTPDPCATPPTAENTTFSSCTQGADSGDVCAASCDAGFVASPDTGAPSATCTAGQYQYSGACVPQNCTEPPVDQANADGLSSCTDLAHGAVCPGTCQTFYDGTVQATCMFGNWTYENTCASTNCTEAPENTDPASNSGYTTCSDFASGSVCSADCATGYSGSGLTATCSNTNWTVSGSCDPDPCTTAAVAGAPANSNGSVSDECELPVQNGGSCSIECSEGYSGTVTTTCVLGSFADVTGSCTGNPCDGPLPEITNATYDGCTDLPYAHEYVCTATCAQGYSNVGAPGATCTAGQWTPNGGCAPASCGTPTQQANALDFSNCATDAHGTACTAECEPFHEGGFTATCQFGSWAYTGSCQPTNCTTGPSTTEPVTGDFECPAGLAAGSVCSAQCSTGYEGSVTATCTNRTWVTDGVCTPMGCSATSVTPAPEGSTGAVSCGSVGLVTHDTTCSIPCSTDFEGTVTTTCRLGQFTNVTGQCVRVAGTCDGLPTAWVDGATFPDTCRNGRTGQGCEARCNQGRLASPVPTVQCVLDPAQPTGGRWAATATGRCIRACPGVPPQQLEGGIWPETCRDSTAFLGLCRGQCNNAEGYIGTPIVQCLTNGWSSAVVGGCRKATALCSTLPSIIINNGRWPQTCLDSQGNGTCTALCNAPRFGGSTPPRITCVVENGLARWDATTLGGSCRRLCTSLPTATVPGGGSWPGSCGGRTAAGGVCTATCNGGLFGAPTVRCNSNGVWATTVTGQCQQQPVCASLPTFSVKFGAWPVSCFDSGANVNCTAQCSTGYSTPESPVATCVINGNTASWVLQNPNALTGCRKVCSGTPDQTLLTGVGSWPASCANTDAPCTGTCDSGFGTPTVACTTNGWSRTVVGRCSDSPVCAGKPLAALNGPGVWPNSCADASVGATCNATCDYGFGGPNQPKVECSANGWQPTSTSTLSVCQKVCMGSPSTSLLPVGGSWPAACAGNVAASASCTGSCGVGFTGTPAPAVICLPTGSWDTSLVGNTGCTPINP